MRHINQPFRYDHVRGQICNHIQQNVNLLRIETKGKEIARKEKNTMQSNRVEREFKISEGERDENCCLQGI